MDNSNSHLYMQGRSFLLVLHGKKKNFSILLLISPYVTSFLFINQWSGQKRIKNRSLKPIWLSLLPNIFSGNLFSAIRKKKKKLQIYSLKWYTSGFLNKTQPTLLYGSFEWYNICPLPQKPRNRFIWKIKSKFLKVESNEDTNFEENYWTHIRNKNKKGR